MKADLGTHVSNVGDAGAARFSDLRQGLAGLLIGRETLIDRLLVALLVGGHVLIEGAPGLAKTRAVKLFAKGVDGIFSRIQATPDLLPSDLTGTNVFRQETGDFDFLPGPLFANVVLVDEVNRAPPKVQSALLEAMGEGQITVGKATRSLAEPFLVAATQNPIEHEGTYPLPEAQLDRFLFFIELPMPDSGDERRVLDLALGEFAEPPDAAVLPIVEPALLAAAKAEVRQVHVSPAVRDYIVRLTAATRGEGAGGAAAAAIEHAASPRASIGLATAGQAMAWLDGRDHVIPSDVKDLAPDILSGRIGLTYRARADGETPRDIVGAILEATPVV
ncbi:MAG: AAA family ATPase [Pseudomonadota bacterium]